MANDCKAKDLKNDEEVKERGETPKKQEEEERKRNDGGSEG